MRRWAFAVAATSGVSVAYVLGHWALIETGREVIVLRTEDQDGSWLETRLWIVDDGGVSWLHGNAESRWMQNLEARPLRITGPDGASTRPVRLERLDSP